MNNVTKKYKIYTILLTILSFILLVVPIVVFSVIAFINGEPHEKLTLGCALTVSLILVLINALFKYHIRSTLWIAILGIYYCMDNILPLLLIIAISTILDEFVITPLKKKYKLQYTINNQFDKRTGE